MHPPTETDESAVDKARPGSPTSVLGYIGVHLHAFLVYHCKLNFTLPARKSRKPM